VNAIAILLAAGESERMGSPKALLPWRGRPLLAHQVRQIGRSRVAECVVVLGREPERLLPLLEAARRGAAGPRVVINPAPQSGKSSSVLAGLASLPERPDAIFVVAVDQPVGHRLLNAMLQAAAQEWEGGETGSSCRTVVVPCHAGRRGHPPLFHGSLIAELMGITEETQGLKAVVRRRPERVLEVPWESADVLRNLNAPDDLPPSPGAAAPRDPARRETPS
jgi:molybdenum cofactor cytidylyltransferase